MSAALQFLQRCKGPCGKQKPPGEIISIGPHVGVCTDCYISQQEAIAALSGEGVPTGCPDCGRSMAELKRTSSDGEARMYLFLRDGVTQLLCGRCSGKYVGKTKHQWTNTPFGRRMKLS